jgi:hypothetical protein
MPSRERVLVGDQQADPGVAAQHAMDHRHLDEARRVEGNPDGVGQFLLEQHEKAARAGDGGHALRLEIARRGDERVEQARVALAHDPFRRRALDHPVKDGKVECGPIADVPGDLRERSLQAQHADRGRHHRRPPKRSRRNGSSGMSGGTPARSWAINRPLAGAVPMPIWPWPLEKETLR